MIKNLLCHLIAAHQRAEKEQFVGIIEVDGSFFGPARVRGRTGPRKRGRGTNKQPVFVIYERNGRVYTELVTDCSASTLQQIIRGKTALGAWSTAMVGEVKTAWLMSVSANICGSTRANI